MRRKKKWDLEEAFDAGRRTGRSEVAPFAAVPLLVTFPDTVPVHEAVIEYERRLLEALPQAHLRPARAAELESRLLDELTAVREWLDAFVESARAYAAEAPYLRRDPRPVPPPQEVRVYASVDEFVAEDPRRGLPDWPERRDARGSDHGGSWTWHDVDRPWAVTVWRVSLIRELSEVYAIQVADRGTGGWELAPDQRPRPVWLLASGVDTSPRHPLLTRNPMAERLSGWAAQLMRKRDSLLLLVDALGDHRVRSQVDGSRPSFPRQPSADDPSLT